MSQLTLSQRSMMAANPNFQNRIGMAVKKTASYWLQLPLDTVAKWNKANKKRKEFARYIMNGNVPVSMYTYAEYLLTQYNEENPDVIGSPDINEGQLSDTAITDSSASALTFDYFAGVQPGDETKPIIF